MKRPLTIAAIQLPAAEESAQPAATVQRANFNLAAKWLDDAGRRGAGLAGLGETFNAIGIPPEARTPAAFKQAHAETLRRFSPLAKKHRMAIVAPILATLDGVLRNVAVVIDERGRHAGDYCKVHCIENETAYGVVPGDSWPVFDIAGTRVGVQICHDNSFPESARCLTLNGAEIIIWPHLMSGWGGEFMDVLLRAPAIHNGVHHVPVCYGCPRDRSWMPGMLIGRSSIIAPDAMILADAGRYPGIALATIDLAAPRIALQFTRPGDWVWKIDMLNDRRPETYDAFTRPHERLKPVPAKRKGNEAAE